MTHRFVINYQLSVRKGYEDHLLINAMSEGCCRSLSLLFNKYYESLCHFARRFVNNPDVAKELVSDIFITLWYQRTSVTITTNVKAYLYAATRNHSINYLKKSDKYAQTTLKPSLELVCHHASPLDKLIISELRGQLERAVGTLPRKRQLIFRMSQLGGFTHQEIALQLNISDKTVGNQLGIAMKYLQRTQVWH